MTSTIPLSSLPNNRRPSVPGLQVGATVTGISHGRRFKVLAADEWVIVEEQATGPYALLQALDDPACMVIWPAGWYGFAGQQLELMGGA